MAAAEKPNDWWVNLQQRREERMRFEVLLMLYEAADRCADIPVEFGVLVKKVGVWEDELDRVLQFLVRRDYIRIAFEISRNSVCLTVQGVDYIERDSLRRRTIRD